MKRAYLQIINLYRSTMLSQRVKYFRTRSETEREDRYEGFIRLWVSKPAGHEIKTFGINQPYGGST